MNERFMQTEPEFLYVVPFDGEFVVRLAGQTVTTFQGKKGDRVSLHWLPPVRHVTEPDPQEQQG